MSDAKKAPLSEKGYGILIGIGALVILSVVAKLLADLYLWANFEHCDPDSYWVNVYGTPPDIVCTTSGLYWNWIGAIGVLIAAVLLMAWAYRKRHHWYREVMSGTVVAHGWYSSRGLLSSGYQEYLVAVAGKNRHGDCRVQWRRVQPRTYYNYEAGDPINFG